MRRAFILFVTLCSISILAAREKVINTPYWSYSDAMELYLKKITLSDTATILTFSILQINSQTWSLSSKTHLEADGKSYKLRYAKKYSEKTEKEVPFMLDSINLFSGNIPDSLIIVFDPIPKKTIAFDFMDGEERNNWHIFDIRTTGEPYPSMMKKQSRTITNEQFMPFVPKSGKAILNVHIHGFKKKYNMACGNPYVGNFITKEDMRWTKENGDYRAELLCFNPTTVNLTLPCFNLYVELLVEPDKELNIDLDIPTLVNKEIEKDKRYKRHKYGDGCVLTGHLAKFNKAMMENIDYRWNRIDSLICDTTIFFNDYVKKIWNKYKTRISETNSKSTLDDQQKEFLNLQIQNDYINDRVRYVNHIRDSYYFKYWDKSSPWSDSIIRVRGAEAEKQATLNDPHAMELSLFKDMRAAYINTDTSLLKYMEANGITSGSFYEWLKDKKKTEAIADGLNAMRPLTDIKVLDSISPVYVPFLLQLNDTAIAYRNRLRGMQKVNTCNINVEKDVLPAIVEQYKGSVVFVDCWATWCGPCNMGIKAMKPIEEEFADKNVKFIFITNGSSPMADWTKMIQTMSGYHYRLTGTQWNNLSGMDGSIPHYFIFDSNGKQLMDHTGWNDENVKIFKDVIQKAINK